MSLVTLTKTTPQIAVLTLNDPQNLNAMSESMAQAFVDQVNHLQSDRDLEVVILTGAGRAFSTGGDLAMLKSKTKLDPAENRRKMLEFYGSFLCIQSLGVPIIAAINGHAVGAGLCVACACDVRLAGENAKFGFTFVKLGLHPGMGATFSVPRVIGAAAASELLLTGGIIDAHEALKIGLCSQVVSDSELMSHAERIAKEICGNGRESVRQLVRSLREDAPQTLKEALDLKSAHQSINYNSAEFSHRVDAAMSKRK